MILTDTELEYVRGLIVAKLAELDEVAEHMILDPVGQVRWSNAVKALAVLRPVLAKMDAEVDT